jgi:uncharacterized protein
MPQYFSPGVYVEEIKPKAQAIAGTGTSTAGFIGIVADDVILPIKPGAFQTDETGQLKRFRADASKNVLLFEVGADGKPDENKPTKDPNGKPIEDPNGQPLGAPYSLVKLNTPILVTSWEEFKSNFGDFQTGNSTLAHAVYGFFNNGGSRCWILRVADLMSLANSLTLFEPIDEIAIVTVPGAITQAQHTDMIAHCAKLQDRVAVLDGDSNKTPDAVSGIRPVGRSAEASYAAIYYPWLKVSNPLFNPLKPEEHPLMVNVPPSGHIAGIYARSDSTRGVFKAPANEGVIGALDTSRPISKAHQDGLNPEGINVIRVFNGAVKVWGARTMADEATSQFRYVSTRRFFNFLRESIDEGTQFAVFEPNSSNLWQGITQTLNGFLLNQWRDGALFGSTPEQAFFVKCDKDTNPKEVRELGQVVTEIGVAIVKPAEFVIFRIQQTTGG